MSQISCTPSCFPCSVTRTTHTKSTCCCLCLRFGCICCCIDFFLNYTHCSGCHQARGLQRHRHWQVDFFPFNVIRHTDITLFQHTQPVSVQHSHVAYDDHVHAPHARTALPQGRHWHHGEPLFVDYTNAFVSDAWMFFKDPADSGLRNPSLGNRPNQG